MKNRVKNIFLIGLMGSGKSTIGKQLNKYLPYSFIDLDLIIEDYFKMPISRIFLEIGERKFREYEKKVFCDKAKEGGYIIATGGGIILSKINRNSLKKEGFTILLKTNPKIISSRIINTTGRPLLEKSNNIENTLNNLWSIRESKYINCSDIIIKNDGNSPKETVNLILNKIN